MTCDRFAMAKTRHHGPNLSDARRFKCGAKVFERIPKNVTSSLPFFFVCVLNITVVYFCQQ